MDFLRKILRNQSEQADRQVTAFGAFISMIWIFIVPQVVMGLIGGGYLAPWMILSFLIFSVPTFPSGLGLMIGMKFNQALTVGWLIYIGLFTAGIRLRNTRAFRTILIVMVVTVLANVGGCYLTMNSPENPGNAITSKQESAPFSILKIYTSPIVVSSF